MSKRTIERRLNGLETDLRTEIPEPWKQDTPRELWHDIGAVWEYELTGGESHPHLEAIDRERPGQ